MTSRQRAAFMARGQQLTRAGDYLIFQVDGSTILRSLLDASGSWSDFRIVLLIQRVRTRLARVPMAVPVHGSGDWHSQWHTI